MQDDGRFTGEALAGEGDILPIAVFQSENPLTEELQDFCSAEEMVAYDRFTEHALPDRLTENEERIDRFPVLTDLEVQTGLLCPACAAYVRDGIVLLDDIADFYQDV